ncbi:glutamate--tRNA ligase family protein [Mucilaginibacter aquatilis]|uniref:tRNA glutamyl-Q synthetase n=1 Tax=Mucilaginibacter aquatilis TaxID=1517760 RepID=A0A6I4I7E2_9SPHI|nr:glutamate--tRNA ligase family protein [Mucilaginibacter aquatilis]MVN91090.1 tRNA glutamyl-Q synthetase [Mucilaginibacter aquatilis]
MSLKVADLSLAKTRIAPTPSGYLHLGNALSFVLTATLAKESGAEILLRIDDMDKERVRDEYVQDVFDTLDFLEITYAEGPSNLHDFKSNWSQQQRMPLYNTILKQLEEEGKVFACRCSRLQLQNHQTYPGTCEPLDTALNSPNAAWRLKTEHNEPVSMLRWPSSQVVCNLSPEMQSFVVRKKDGRPSYQLSSLCDDIHFGVDLIVRGQDLFASTVAQQYLAQQLDFNSFERCVFYHHPLIEQANGIKLSKSAGATSIKYLRENGYKKNDVLNQMAEHLELNGSYSSWQQLGEGWLANLKNNKDNT